MTWWGPLQMPVLPSGLLNQERGVLWWLVRGQRLQIWLQLWQKICAVNGIYIVVVMVRNRAGTCDPTHGPHSVRVANPNAFASNKCVQIVKVCLGV